MYIYIMCINNAHTPYMYNAYKKYEQYVSLLYKTFPYIYVCIYNYPLFALIFYKNERDPTRSTYSIVIFLQ